MDIEMREIVLLLIILTHLLESWNRIGWKEWNKLKRIKFVFVFVYD